ncbi:MAG TPA: hypothetical protein ENO27_02885 [Caldithrix sp.]|nr:hypothetical protein [Caldithrix sp.]
MPTPADILTGLSIIANDMIGLAIVWHILAAAAIIGIIFGWRPSKRSGASLLSIPLLSVGIIALKYDNPFNGVVFLFFSVVLLVLASRLPKKRIQKAPIWAFLFGIFMILFGWIYPHFLQDGTWLKYLYAAPMGLIPCPTLSFTIGFAMLANGFSSRVWSIVLVIIGVFYSLFGALRLGVHLDFVLLAGSLLLLIQVLILKSAVPSRKASK